MDAAAALVLFRLIAIALFVLGAAFGAGFALGLTLKLATGG